MASLLAIAYIVAMVVCHYKCPPDRALVVAKGIICGFFLWFLAVVSQWYLAEELSYEHTFATRVRLCPMATFGYVFASIGAVLITFPIALLLLAGLLQVFGAPLFIPLSFLPAAAVIILSASSTAILSTAPLVVFGKRAAVTLFPPLVALLLLLGGTPAGAFLPYAPSMVLLEGVLFGKASPSVWVVALVNALAYISVGALALSISFREVDDYGGHSNSY